MSEMEMKAMIFGFMYGDGWLSHVNNETYNHYCVGFSGDEKSLNILKNDLKSIYKEIGKAKINTRQTCSENYNINGITSAMTVNTKIAKDMIALGMPTGKKVEQEYLLPDWITNGSYKIKSAFISGLYAAEGYTPCLQANDKTFKVLGFNITKRKSLEQNFKEFIGQLSNILNDLRISHTIKYEDTYTCEASIKAKITFDNNNCNLISASYAIQTKYNANKEELLNAMFGYCLLKEVFIQNLQSAYQLALTTKQSAKSIATAYSITQSQVENWRRRKAGIQIPKTFQTFTSYCSL